MWTEGGLREGAGADLLRTSRMIMEMNRSDVVNVGSVLVSKEILSIFANTIITETVAEGKMFELVSVLTAYGKWPRVRATTSFK